MSSIRVGSRVVIEIEDAPGSSAARLFSSYEGFKGRVVERDPEDKNYPYCVELDGDTKKRAFWVHKVRTLTAEEK